MSTLVRRILSFDTRYKFRLHIVILVLIVAVMAITGVRVLVKTGPSTRSDTMALAMGAKSIFFIAYQLVTEHTRRFAKWASLKANAILNGLEIVFWSAVCFLTMQGLMKNCSGTACVLGWVSLGVAVFVTKFEFYMFVISWLDFRHFKRNGKHRSSDV